MDVLFDYRPALRDRTGVGAYVHELLVALSARQTAGERIHLFSSSWKDRLLPSPDLEAPGIELHDHHLPGRTLNWTWHRLGRPSVEWLTGSRFDVVHAAHPLIIPTRAAATVVTIHDLDFLDHPDRARAEIRRDYPRLARAHAQRADAIVTVSPDTRERILERLGVGAGKVVVAPPGVPSWARGGRQSPRNPGGTILFVGTVEPRKNVGALLDAYQTLVERRRDAPLLCIVGRVTDAARPWVERAARLPLAGRVSFAGYVTDDERRAQFEAASMLVLPSWHEGFGLAALEAMAMGVPVVAARRGALGDLVADAGVLTEPDDVGALADALERVLDDTGLADTLAARGLARAGAFSWERTADAVRHAYTLALARRAERHAHRH